MRVIDPTATIVQQFHQRERFMSLVERWQKTIDMPEILDQEYLNKLRADSGVLCEFIINSHGSFYTHISLSRYEIEDRRQYSIFLLQYG